METMSNLFIKNVENLPIWVKQVLASEISQDLQKKLSDFTDLIQGNTLFQYLKPNITFKGKQELENRNLKLSDGYYTFLKDVFSGTNNIFEITIKNNWALADSAKIFIRLNDLELVSVPEQANKNNIAIASFIASKIKTGEFLKKIDKINADQLEQALRYQKQLNEEGRHIKMASILIKMGFITDRGLDSLLLLKDEAKRRLSFNLGFTSMQYENEDEKENQLMRMQKELSRLENENIIMKKHLKKLLNVK